MRTRILIVPKTTSKKAATPKAKAVSKAKPKKKAAVKRKPSATGKKVSEKTPARPDAGKKPVTKKSGVKKSADRTAATRKTTGKKAPAPKKAVSGKTPSAQNGKTPQSGPKLSKPAKGKALNKRELKKFEKILLELRERLQGDIRFLTTDNLHRAGRETGADLSGSAQHSADHGTDNFDREFALSLASTEQDVLYEVDEALMRIHDGSYGICEMTGVQIERARLQVIPYTRYSVQAQSKMEQSRAKYRPFAQTFKGW